VNGDVLLRREGILTAIQGDTIQILRKIPNLQVTVMNRIGGGLVYSVFRKRYFFPDCPIIAEKVFWKGGGDCY
jgi:hypothetical protein